MNRWTDIGPIWNTETTYRIRELLKENRIPFRMPFDEMFFQSMYHLPHRDRIWGIQVQKKDSARVMSMLAKEGLIHTPVQQPGKCQSGKPVSFTRQWGGPFQAVRTKKWTIPRPGTGNA